MTTHLKATRQPNLNPAKADTLCGRTVNVTYTSRHMIVVDCPVCRKNFDNMRLSDKLKFVRGHDVNLMPSSRGRNG